MKNSLITLFAILAFVGSVLPLGTSSAYAAIGDVCPDGSEETAAGCPQAGGGPPSTPAGTDSDTEAPKKNATAPQLGQSDDGSGTGWMVKALTPVMTMLAWLMGIAALTLDASIHYTVIQMGDTLNPNQYAAVGVTWRILRDIGNIILIFGFLAIGISIIIGNEIIGYGQKLLPRLLIAAVALNFSLFAAEAVIDVGNMFATQFYTQINGGTLPEETNAGFLEALSKQGVGSKVFAVFGFQTFYGDTSKNAKLFTGDNQMLISFMAITVFLVAAFVFFSLAFMFIARFILLVFLIITSPIGVAGFAMPKLESAAKQWWDHLFKQTMTAPVLLLGLYIALMVITDDLFLQSFGAKSHGWTVGISQGADDSLIGMILAFVIAMGLLLGVMVIAKKMGAVGADAAMKLGGRLSFGTTGFLGRTVLGGGFRYGLNNRFFRAAAGRSGVVGTVAKGVSRTGRFMARRTYDVRNIPGIVSTAGGYGISAGKPATRSYVQGVKDYKDWRENYSKEARDEEAKALSEKRFRNAQTSTTETQAQLDALREERQALIDKYGSISASTEADYKKKEEDYQKIIDTNSLVIRGELAKMQTKQLEELDGIKNGVEALVKNLSPQQFEALLKSEKLNEKQKANLKRTRYLDFEKAVASGDAGDIKKAIGALSKGELEAIPSELLSNEKVLQELSDKQRETIADSKERTAAEKDMVRNSSRTGKIEAMFKEEKERAKQATPGITDDAAAALAAAATAAHADFAKLTVAQIAKLDKEMLKQRAVAEQLSAASLMELQEQKKLNQEEMRIIGEHIVNNTGGTAKSKTQAYINSGPGNAYWG